MSKTLNLKVVSPMDVVLESQDVVFIRVKTTNGDVGILPNHVNYVTALGRGQMLVKTKNGDEKSYFVESGFLELCNNDITIIVEDAYLSSREEIVKKERELSMNKAKLEKIAEDKDVIGMKKRIQDSLRK